MMRVRDQSINMDAIKALCVVYGPTEAARQAKLPIKRVCRWAYRYGWKKAERLVRTSGYNSGHAIASKDAGDLLTRALQNHKDESILNLAAFVAGAAKEAKRTKKKLPIAKQVRDVSTIFRNVFPAEKEDSLIAAAILVGSSEVKDDPVEILADARVVE